MFGNDKVTKDNVHLQKEKPPIDGLGKPLEDITKEKNNGSEKGNNKKTLTEKRLEEATVPGSEKVVLHLNGDQLKNQQQKAGTDNLNKKDASKPAPLPSNNLFSMAFHLPEDPRSLPALLKFQQQDLTNVPVPVILMCNLTTGIVTAHFLRTVEKEQDALEQVLTMFPEGFKLPAVTEEVGFDSTEIRDIALRIAEKFIGQTDANDKLEILANRLKKAYPYHETESSWLSKVEEQALTIASTEIKGLITQISEVKPGMDYSKLLELVEEGFKTSSRSLLKKEDAEKLKTQFQPAVQEAQDFLLKQSDDEEALSFASQLVRRKKQVYAPAPIVS